MCVWVVARLPQRLKINVFWNFFFTPLAPSRPLHLKFFKKTLILAFQKMLILAFEANSALSHENETKIVKITHSAHGHLLWNQKDFVDLTTLAQPTPGAQFFYRIRLLFTLLAFRNLVRNSFEENKWDFSFYDFLIQNCHAASVPITTKAGNSEK